AKRYRGSRTPVREAAVRLQQENLLRIVPNRGYFVRHVTINELNELYEYRAALEGACAELAARKGGDQAALDEMRRLGQIHFEKNDRPSYERFIEADTAFHLALAQLTRNQLLVNAVRAVRCQMERGSRWDYRLALENTVFPHHLARPHTSDCCCRLRLGDLCSARTQCRVSSNPLSRSEQTGPSGPGYANLSRLTGAERPVWGS